MLDALPASASQPASAAEPTYSLQDILTTEQLQLRPSRLPNYEAESKALVALACALAESPRTILQKLVDTAMHLCNAGSAGISVLEKNDAGEIFRWHATAGAFAPFCGGTMPRNFSPCGVVLDRNATQLMTQLPLYYPYVSALKPEISEVLLIPFHRENVPIGTVWVLSHSPEKKFDAEDARLVGSVAKFAAAATQTLANLNAVQAANESLRTEALERERAVAARRENEEFHRFAAEAGRTGSWYVRLDTMECTLSPIMAELMGFPAGQATASASQWRNAVIPEHRAAIDAAIADSVTHDLPFDFEFQIALPTGRRRWLYSHGGVVRTPDGTPLRIHGASVDITARKLAEEELREARDAAESANRAKDKFLAVLSHELRTPLSPVVITLPSMEADPGLPPKFRDDLAMIRRNIDLEVKLIDDLLDLSRVTSGKLRLNLQPTGAHELLLHVIQNSIHDTGGKNLHIRHEFLATHDHLSADPARLQQVFWNLLRNAVKFTPNNGNILIRTENNNHGNGIKIEIRDTGIGIPVDILARIFDAFEQGDPRVTRQFGGLGLGLAIAKALVEMHGGAIHAHSAGHDQGAAFIIELQTVNQPHTTNASSPLPCTRPPLPSPSSRILLVEDHPDTARTMARVLESQGFAVKTAHSVAAALHLAAAEPFDVVVSDIGLPDATGYDLMRQLHALYNLKGIALSGYGMEDDIRKSRQAGFLEHIVKPINISNLEAILHRVIASP